MVRFLARVGIFVVSCAVGLLVASLILDGMVVRPVGFVATVVIFALAQSILSPFTAKMVKRHASAFLGGVGLISTFVALLLASLLANSLTIAGLSTWIAATVVVWLVTAVATLIMPAVLLKARRSREGTAE